MPSSHSYENLVLKIKGKCTECGNEISLNGIHSENSKDLMLNLSTSDTRDIIHIRKRQCRGPERKTVAEELRKISTYNFRRRAAEQHMQFGDQEPANLFSADVLRKVKQECRDAELGVGPTENPVDEVVKLKYNPEFSGSIREIAASKFYVMYWTAE